MAHDGLLIHFIKHYQLDLLQKFVLPLPHFHSVLLFSQFPLFPKLRQIAEKEPTPPSIYHQCHHWSDLRIDLDQSGLNHFRRFAQHALNHPEPRSRLHRKHDHRGGPVAP